MIQGGSLLGAALLFLCVAHTALLVSIPLNG